MAGPERSFKETGDLFTRSFVYFRHPLVHAFYHAERGRTVANMAETAKLMGATTRIRSSFGALCLAMLVGSACTKEVPGPATNTVIVVDTTGVPPGMVADIDGNVYATTVISGKRWFAENLKTTHYANGSPIPYQPVNADWGGLTTGAWTAYNNDLSYEVHYGKLYNWYTVIDPRNACPTGWHVPTDEEWKQLELALGVPDSTLNSTGPRGSAANTGGRMKSTDLWAAPNAGADNSSGFTAYPGGGRSNSGGFYAIGVQGNWWSSSPFDSTQAMQRRLLNNDNGIFRFAAMKIFGNSVRCVED